MMKSTVLKTIAFSLCFALSGCAFWQDGPQSTSATSSTASSTTVVQTAIVDASPYALTRSLALYQQLFVEMQTADTKTETATFEAYLLADGRRIKLNLTHTNVPVWQITYDGQTIHEERQSAVPAELNARYLLSDIALAYWPEKFLVRQLSPLTLRSEQNKRLIFDAEGNVLTDIAYSNGASPENPQGTITLTNHALRYRIIINSHSVY